MSCNGIHVHRIELHILDARRCLPTIIPAPMSAALKPAPIFIGHKFPGTSSEISMLRINAKRGVRYLNIVVISNYVVTMDGPFEIHSSEFTYLPGAM